MNPIAARSSCAAISASSVTARSLRRIRVRSSIIPTASGRLAVRSPPAYGKALGLREIGDADADHRFAETLADLRQDFRVVEVGGGFDDRLGPARRIARLEDSRADENAIDPELHHQGRIGRSGEASGGEVHNGQASEFLRLAHELKRGADLFGVRHQLLIGGVLELAYLTH